MGNCKSSTTAKGPPAARSASEPSDQSTLAVQTPRKSPQAQEEAPRTPPRQSSEAQGHRKGDDLALVIEVKSPKAGSQEHPNEHHDPHHMPNSSMTQTPFVQSVFAYPESPQLQGPRHGEDNISSRQRTGSLPPPDTPLSSYLPVPQSTHIFPQITPDLLAQLQWNQPMPPARHPTQSPRKAHEAEPEQPDVLLVEQDEVALATTNDEDDVNFAMARRNASIQHVLSWMDTGSSGMGREDSELGRNYSCVDEYA